MTLNTGRRLGPYEIVAAIGAGGMGEVYRAKDTKLNRDVAIKVLPELFATDPERLARFTREAQTLALLNHPNIAHIHGLEEHNVNAHRRFRLARRTAKEIALLLERRHPVLDDRHGARADTLGQQGQEPLAIGHRIGRST
jgi:serine/threonine protein kinase